ncbi:hypothetical protein KKG48_01440 [Patescibacteria group bacterium]|nr:hypothetical protein [Patescibacteria group bacterium]MCG2694835.1 hypothetical protein [Candidatus Parcubacteria bacterium]
MSKCYNSAPYGGYGKKFVLQQEEKIDVGLFPVKIELEKTMVEAGILEIVKVPQNKLPKLKSSKSPTGIPQPLTIHMFYNIIYYRKWGF